MTLSERTVQRALSALDEAEIESFAAVTDERGLVVRVGSNEDQIVGREAIQDALGDEYVAALNLAPTTPDWLARLGASPMKYGLDLSGGGYGRRDGDRAIARADRSRARAGSLYRLRLRPRRVPGPSAPGRRRLRSARGKS